MLQEDIMQHFYFTLLEIPPSLKKEFNLALLLRKLNIVSYLTILLKIKNSNIETSVFVLTITKIFCFFNICFVFWEYI